MSEYRIERDSMGELKVPADALYGAQTQRAVDNFPISGLPMPREFIRALGLIKSAAAQANADLGHLTKTHAKAIRKAAERVAAGEFDAQFPIDVFQTGSGTSSNMNAKRAHGIALMVHANTPEMVETLLKHARPHHLAAATGLVRTHRINRSRHRSRCTTWIPPDTGRRPLHIAAAQGHMAAVELFLKHGADPNVRSKGADWERKNALALALMGNHTEVAQLLRQHTTLPFQPIRRPSTPFRPSRRSSRLASSAGTSPPLPILSIPHSRCARSLFPASPKIPKDHRFAGPSV